MSNDALPLLDLEVFNHLVCTLDPGGEKRLGQRVLCAFQESSGKLWLQAQEALAQGDWEVMHRVAHTLKSSSATIGAVRLAQHCSELEAALNLKEDGVADSTIHAQAFSTLEVLIKSTLASVKSLTGDAHTHF
jgi:HPt (histidine-containing phosphotransfer) domain-containing protein